MPAQSQEDAVVSQDDSSQRKSDEYSVWYKPEAPKVWYADMVKQNNQRVQAQDEQWRSQLKSLGSISLNSCLPKNNFLSHFILTIDYN